MNLAHAVEANLAEWVLAKAAAAGPGVEIHEDRDCSWTLSRLAAPENTVVLANFSERSVRPRIRAILGESLKLKSACTWITGPASGPDNLAAELRSAGFNCRIHCAGMVTRLADVPSAPTALPPGAAIVQTDSCPPFEPLTTDRRKLAQKMKDGLAAMRPRRAWHFAATLDGKPVGRTTLFAGAGVAGIYDVEVLREARGRGLATALVHTALRTAIANGHEFAVLAATGAGFGVYQRLGFQEVTKISFWRFGKMRQGG